MHALAAAKDDGASGWAWSVLDIVLAGFGLHKNQLVYCRHRTLYFRGECCDFGDQSPPGFAAGRWTAAAASAGSIST